MKKALCVFLSLLLCFSCAATAAADDDDLKIDGDGALYQYDGDADKVVVPEGVTTLEEGVFVGKSLSEITLPNSLEVIESYVFSECKNLKAVTIPKNVKEIGEYVFDYCPSLKNISVAAGNQYYKSVDGVLFDKAGELLLRYPEAKSGASYAVPDTVKTIAPGAFYATSLSSVTMGDNVEAIKCYSFEDCPNLAEIKIGKGVKTIGEWVFGNDKKLTAIDLPASLQEFGTFVFDNCTGLTAINVAEGGAAYTSVDGVMYTKDMRTVVKHPEGKSAADYTLPDTVKRLAVGAFTRCDFTEIDLSNVTYIEMCGLNECKQLKKVTLGAGLTDIEWGAFSHDEALTDVYYSGNASTWKEINIDKDENGCLLNAALHYTGGADVPHPSRSGEIGDPWRPEDLPPAGRIIFEGDWGEDLPYTLDANGTLTISGSGATFGYVTVEFQTGWWSPGMPLPTWSPLHAYKESIKRVVLTSGMTVLGPNVFFECSRITDVYYDGTPEQWNALDIREGNEYLTGAVIHFRAPDPATCAHTWDAGTVTTAATCAATGEIVYTCVICNTTKTETLPKDTDNHTGGTEIRNAAEATCGKAGYTGDTYCKGCGAVLTPGETIPATGNHTWDEGKITKAATASAEGEKTFTCGICEATKTEPIPKLAPSKEEFRLGDVSGDGEVTAEDARLALRAAVGLEDYAAGSAEFLAADATKDNAITAEDARLILRAAVGLETLV